MFNSSIIDVAIGVTLTFLAVSLAASAITEAISSMMSWREHNLLKGIQALLNDPEFTGIARDVYNHALVNPLASGTATSVQTLTHKPAYIDSRQFAMALYNTFKKNSDQGAVEESDPAKVIEKIPNDQLKQAMRALWAVSAQDLNAFKNNIAVWFDNSMDRLSGWYKRWTQWVSFFVALAIAFILNVNVLYEGARIWTRPAAIADLAANHFDEDWGRLDASKGNSNPDHQTSQNSAKLLDAGKVNEPAAKNGGNPDHQTLQNSVKVFNALESEFLIGWVDGPKPELSFSSWSSWPFWSSWIVAISSWLIVAGATLFGASFWFDMLQRLTHLRGTGLSPERSDVPPSGA